MAKVMIVDDSLFIRKRMEKLLAEHGYETATAADGMEAVRSYKQVDPDIVLMDVTMPRKNGLDALAEIRQFDPIAKVVMLTALDQQAVATKAIQMGAKDFLVKPVRPGQLLMILQKVLK